MFKFYVVLAGHDKVSDAGRATTCRLKLKAPSLQTKDTKTEGAFENMSFSKKNVCFNKKKQTFSHDQTTPWNTRVLSKTIEYGPRKQ